MTLTPKWCAPPLNPLRLQAAPLCKLPHCSLPRMHSQRSHPESVYRSHLPLYTWFMGRDVLYVDVTVTAACDSEKVPHHYSEILQ